MSNNPDIRSTVDRLWEHLRAAQHAHAGSDWNTVRADMTRLEGELGIDRVAGEAADSEHPERGDAVCSRCGPRSTVYHIEAVEQRRPIIGYNEYGVMVIEGLSECVDEGGGDNQRLMCGNCGHEWPLPDAIEYD